MKLHRKKILTASILASLCFTNYVYAQAVTEVTTPDGPQAQDPGGANAAKRTDTQEMEPIIVYGIRESLKKSLDTKRIADSHVEVITAEDIGKMPDKNVADSLQRIPGVTTSSAGANEGGFDENDRVSMRGTNPGLTQTLINGHTVSSGDWFVLIDATDVGALPAAMLRFSGNTAVKPPIISSGTYRLMWDLAKSDIGG